MRIHRFLSSFSIGLLLSITVNLRSQPYVEGGNTQHRFAQTYVGADLQHVPGMGETFGVAFVDPVAIPGRIVPRLTIGGLHFWGHADFYVTFPIPPHGFETESDGLHSFFSTGIETGGRFYPWRLEQGTIRPFVGASWALVNYAQRESDGDWGPTLFRHRGLLHGGLSWMIGPGIIEAEGTWIPGTDVRYPVSRAETASIRLPGAAVKVGFKYPFETTVSAEYAAQSGWTEEQRRRMDSAGQLSTWMIGAGPSAAFTLGRSSWITEERPWLDAIPPSTPFPDLSLGYYLHRLDAVIGLAYRPISQVQEAYGVELALHRHSLRLEAYKFLFDYNGFVPFVGLGIGAEWLEVLEHDGASAADVTARSWSPGIVFGWDIRPTPIDWFTLRTNLRYTPGLSVTMPSGNDVSFDQLEFNFIQLVLYPERMFGL